MLKSAAAAAAAAAVAAVAAAVVSFIGYIYRIGKKKNLVSKVIFW